MRRDRAPRPGRSESRGLQASARELGADFRLRPAPQSARFQPGGALGDDARDPQRAREHPGAGRAALAPAGSRHQRLSPHRQRLANDPASQFARSASASSSRRVAENPALSPGPYRAPWWLPGGHLQTLYGPLIGRSKPRWKRERWDTPDGDFIDVDRLAGPADSPLVVLFHGLEGGSSSHYARAFARELGQRGWRGAVPHFRGCSGEPNGLPRAYHSGDAEEIGWILRRLRGESPDAPLFAVGVSLGGNAFLKWLGVDARAEDVVCA